MALDFRISFTPLTEEHLAQLHQWFQVPHVKKWYARNKAYTLKMIQDKYRPRIQNPEKIHNYIISVDDHPIGYIQYYHLDTFLPEGISDHQHPLFELYPAQKIAGIDIFIGDEKFLHKGHGAIILKSFIEEFIQHQFSAAVVDPVKDNSSAIHFFQKQGFYEYPLESSHHSLFILNLELISKAQSLISNHFNSPIKITSINAISEPDRENFLLRLFLNNWPHSLILKQNCRDRFLHEQIALKAVSGKSFAPKFIGADIDSHFFIMEDLSDYTLTLVDKLLGKSRSQATMAINAFMQTLGAMHASTHRTDIAWEERFEKEVDTLLPSFQAANTSLGLTLTNESIEEAKSIITLMLKPGPFTALTHGDICPDNVLIDTKLQQIRFIDFEWADWQNALRDAVFLRMNMPTCWCAKALPPDVIDTAESIYRDSIKSSMPVCLNDDEYYAHYVAACGYWMLRTLPFIETLIDNDEIWPSGAIPKGAKWDPDANSLRSRVLSRLQSFYHIANYHQRYRHSRTMVSEMLKKLTKLWPEVLPLEFYPPFK